MIKSCNEFWTEADHLSESLKIPNRVSRRRKLCSRLAGSIVDAPVEADDRNSFEAFKGNIFSVIDRMLFEMKRRFSSSNMISMKGIDALTPSSENFLDEQTITEFANEYSSLVTVDFITAEIANLKQMLKRTKDSDSEGCPASLLQFQCYVRRLRDAFSEVDKLLTIACTLPVSTASCERSFSTLRMVKSYLRTTMQNDRLQDLLVLGIHRSRASKLNFDDAVSRFSRKFPTCKIQLY